MDAGQETTVNALGRSWIIARTEIAQLEKLALWVKERQPDPWRDIDRLVALAEKLPTLVSREDVMAEIKEAKAKRDAIEAIDFMSPLVHKLLTTSVAAQMHMLWLLLQVRHPDITRDQVAAICAEVGEEKLVQAIARGRGGFQGNGQAPAAKEALAA